MEGIEGSLIFVAGSPDGHAAYAEPRSCEIDPLAESLKDEKHWRKEIPEIAMMLHKTPEGYRYRSTPSLNVHVHQDVYTNCGRVYEIDLDRWSPGWDTPVNSIRHIFLEVLPHHMFSTTTSQDGIAKMLKHLSFKSQPRR